MTIEDISSPSSGVRYAQRYLNRITRVAVWRLVRFGVMGAITFVVQIGLLVLLKDAGLGAILAYAIGLAVAVQFNFVTNQLFVWDDRPLSGIFSRSTLERWVTFHGCIGLSLVLNFGAFVLARLFIGDLPAAVVGVALSTVVKFLSLDRVAFREGDAVVGEVVA
ncbi:MAG TPA: GtrA family protein [Dehalococcoidia bacterium]|nr:GtrA family protein [Dehalococcoidia bacterium]